MTKSFVLSAGLAAGLAIAGAGPAFAWQNNGSYTGPNGGTVNWSQGCGPHGQFCARKWSATTPGGTTYNGAGTIRNTPYGGHVANRWYQGPNASFYTRRRW